jgi:medium-chain acyl-[acyl-carrier-protein] hydrolase
MDKTKWICHERIGSNSKINLICFPHAGGTAAYFARWGKFFSDKVSILPVQFPMREKRIREKMQHSVQDLAKVFVQENKGLFSEPFAFFGHCSGSIVAYEVASYVNEYYNLKPQHLFVSSAVSPEAFKVEQLSLLSREELLDYIVEWGYVAKELLEDDMMVDYFLPIVRKDFELQENYKCESIRKLSCPIVALNGKQDENMKSTEKINHWSNFTENKFETASFNGTHFYIDENMESVCQFVEKRICHSDEY